MGTEEDIQRINKEITERFSKIEAAVASAETIAGLFEILFDGIEKEFEVPFVWLTLIDHEKAAPVIAAVQSSEILQNRLCVVSPELLENILPEGLKPILSNKDLQPFYKLMPLSRKYFVRSMAVVPFTLDGQIIGTWNNGDADTERYRDDMDTGLLFSLADLLSMKLTQLVAGKSTVSGNNQNNENPGGLNG